MKKLAIVVLLVVSACRRQAVVTTVPTQQTPQTPAASNAPGGATPREAVARFLAASKVQDVQAMSNVWGSKEGPARTSGLVPADQLEMRIIYMIRCTRHDSYAVKSETAVTGGERQFAVELKLKTTVALIDFTATPGRDGRWYVRTLDLEQAQPICGTR